MRLLTALIAAAAAVALAGCPNPNAIGVQTTGTLVVTTVDGSSGQPVSGVLVSAGSNYTCTTGTNGVCTSVLTLPVGQWTVVAHAPGLSGTANVTITANTQSTTTIQMNP
jgi:hypothetical protein